jgi:hypothetical protein
VARTYVTLCVYPPADVDPVEVTARLGLEATSSVRRGEPARSPTAAHRCASGRTARGSSHPTARSSHGTCVGISTGSSIESVTEHSRSLNCRCRLRDRALLFLGLGDWARWTDAVARAARPPRGVWARALVRRLLPVAPGTSNERTTMLRSTQNPCWQARRV